MNTGEKILEALRPYKLKQEGENRWRCNDPFRHGSNSFGFTLTIEQDGEHGAYYDHVFEESGSLYELANKLKIGLPDRTEIGTTKRAYTGLEDYATAHGVPKSIFERAGWKETTRQDRPALEFPTETGKRWRFMDGNKPKFKSVFEYQRCWYGLHSAVEIAKRTGLPLIIVNGEPGSIVGQYFELPTCCITAGEKKEYPAHLIQALQAIYSGPIIVAFDCLDKGAAASLELAQLLTDAGFEARAVDLNLSKGGDIADFCKLHGKSAAEAIQQCKPPVVIEPNQHTLARGEYIHIAKLDQIPPTEWLVKGEIPTEGLVMVYGPSGIGKSFFMLDYSCEIGQKLPVAYAAMEGKSGFPKRTQAWSKHNKVPLSALNVHFFFETVPLLDRAAVDIFIEKTRPINPCLVILDTLGRASLGGDLNSSKDVIAYIAACDAIQTALKCAVVIVHHSRKNDSTFTGNMYLYNSCDTVIKLTKDDDLIIVESDKTKDEEPFATRYMKLLPVMLDDGTTKPVIVKASLIKSGPNDKLTPQQIKILNTLAMEIYSDGASNADLVSITDIGAGSISKTVSRLMTLGHVAAMGSKTFAITKQGRAALSRDSSDSNLIPINDSNTLATSQRDSMIPFNSHFLQKETQSQFEESPESVESMESEESKESLESNYEKAQRGVCPVCDVLLTPTRKGLNCPDCGVNWKVRG